MKKFEVLPAYKGVVVDFRRNKNSRDSRMLVITHNDPCLPHQSHHNVADITKFCRSASNRKVGVPGHVS